MGKRGAPPEAQFQPGNLAAKGHGKARFPKPYSEAAFQYLTMRNGQAVPDGWPADRKEWTIAQVLVERHASLAMAGSQEMTEWLVERAEGKTPMAPEDREAKAKADGAAAALLLGGMSAIGALRQLLKLPDAKIIDTTVVEDADKG